MIRPSDKLTKRNRRECFIILSTREKPFFLVAKFFKLQICTQLNKIQVNFTSKYKNSIEILKNQHLIRMQFPQMGSVRSYILFLLSPVTRYTMFLKRPQSALASNGPIGTLQTYLHFKFTGLYGLSSGPSHLISICFLQFQQQQNFFMLVRMKKFHCQDFLLSLRVIQFILQYFKH